MSLLVHLPVYDVTLLQHKAKTGTIGWRPEGQERSLKDETHSGPQQP